MNVDGCRVEAASTEDDRRLREWPRPNVPAIFSGFTSTPGNGKHGRDSYSPSGRWPANLVLDEDAAAMMDEVVGERIHGAGHARSSTRECHPTGLFGLAGDGNRYGDSGGPSRFFYCSKVSRTEAEAGLRGVLPCVVCGGIDTETHLNAKGQEVRCHRNSHPTRKPIKLMEWLCRLVTPPGGTALDPFAGSGSTLIAAGLEGFGYLGCEKEEEYVRIAEARLAHWLEQPTLIAEAAG